MFCILNEVQFAIANLAQARLRGVAEEEERRSERSGMHSMSSKARYG